MKLTILKGKIDAVEAFTEREGGYSYEIVINNNLALLHTPKRLKIHAGDSVILEGSRRSRFLKVRSFYLFRNDIKKMCNPDYFSSKFFGKLNLLLLLSYFVMILFDFFTMAVLDLFPYNDHQKHLVILLVIFLGLHAVGMAVTILSDYRRHNVFRKYLSS